MLNDDERSQLANFGNAATEEVETRRVYGCNADLPPEERTSNDGVEGTLTPRIKPSQEWSAIPLRGVFSFGENQLGIWNKFFRLQRSFANRREYPDYLRNADEFPDEDDRKKAVNRDANAFGLLQVPRTYIREIWRTFILNQATEESAILPKAQDMSLGVRDAMEPVRPAMKRGIELVKDSNSGLRKFGKGYAYFLRRTCIDRPCNDRLETILKVLFSDECFPYASGVFQVKDGDEPENPTWQDCVDAVEEL